MEIIQRSSSIPMSAITPDSTSSAGHETPLIDVAKVGATRANAATGPLIDVRDLSLRFSTGSEILAAVNLEVKQGEFVALLGPSGCGKSTLLRVMAGLIHSTGGEVTIDGLEPASARKNRHPLAFVFQDPTLLPWRTVRDNIRLPLELQGVPYAEQMKAVEASLPLIGLTTADATKRPRSLSGGMRMRVSLARALVTNPHILFMDEPFAALDDVLRQQLNEEVLALSRQKQWTCVFVTHNVAEAAFMADRVLVMRSKPGAIARVIEVPFAHPRTAALRESAEFAQFAGQVNRELREVMSW
ncbi:ABC transporter related protein [Planctopirus limnophila DSM 3776]|uniref:ABC transporter related protein n=1 Tax=Planctopirus limnophila (strain ATCC 43296 / DSM 3776 / IFAM 1008 / Mu 290) TaxID=521674 RepID=D5SRJ5_PLAL2|nr:ABC transporter ATP-binding protein [Planctopirus limnophila]ADG68688.1 ABC transporter related protein [Planctopirus limnophila DSM 3776]